jgi:hypothetical protein
MTALPQDLLERARRHGLVRADNGWFRTGLPGVVVCPPFRDSSFRGWSWSPPREDGGAWATADGYPTEEAALRACLDWFDLQAPDLAWKPAPWAPVVEVLRRLRGSCETLAEAPSIAAHAEAESLQEAIALLEQATLGPNMASTPEQALSLLLDMAGDRGGELGEGLREQLRRVLQARPDEAIEIVDNLNIGGLWCDGERYAIAGGTDIGETELLARVIEVTGGWTAEVRGERLEDGEGPMLWGSEKAAQAAADAQLLEEGIALAGGPVVLCSECRGEGVFGGCTTCGEEQPIPLDEVQADEDDAEDEDYDPLPCPECDDEGIEGGCDACGWSPEPGAPAPQAEVQAAGGEDDWDAAEAARPINCPRCGGLGTWVERLTDERHPCAPCEGTGFVQWP